MRDFLYGCLRLANDYRAVRRNRIPQRIGRRVAGRVTGRMIGRMFR